MRRSLEDGLEIDDDRERVDVDAVHRYLSEQAYWVMGRSARRSNGSYGSRHA
jgi:hypothetical protein